MEERAGALVQPLTGCNAWQRGAYTLTGQQSEADFGDVGTGELAPRAGEQESRPCLLLMIALGDLA